MWPNSIQKVGIAGEIHVRGEQSGSELFGFAVSRGKEEALGFSAT